MPWLDPRERCHRCDAPFAAGSARVCPGCGVDLASVGTQSQLREWHATRQRGRTRFVLGWVLGWGGLIAAVQCALYAWRGESDWACMH